MEELKARKIALRFSDLLKKMICFFSSNPTSPGFCCHYPFSCATLNLIVLDLKIENKIEGTSIIKATTFGDLRKLCDIHDFWVKNS